jgi:hypothetical protein
VQQTNDGGYILVGQTASIAPFGYWIVKLDANGDTMWTRSYGAPGGYSQARDVKQTADGGYIIAGWTEGSGAAVRDAYLMKLNASGDSVWARMYGGAYSDWAHSVVECSGGYVFCGRSEFVSDYDYYLVRTNEMGDTVWTRKYKIDYGGGTNRQEYAECVTAVAQGGFAVVGTANMPTGGWNIWLITVDEGGDTVWTRTYDYGYHDYGFSVVQTADSGFAIAGGAQTVTTGTYDYLLLRTDPTGATLWSSILGYWGDDWGYSVVQTSDGGFLLGGTGYNPVDPYSMDCFLWKTDENGDSLWTGFYGGMSSYNDEDGGLQAIETADGGYAIAGYSNAFGNDYQYYIVKLEGAGYACGDANGEGSVTTGDGYAILNYFGSGPQPVECETANVNGDGILTTGDGYHLLNYFGSGPALNCAECEF